MCCGYGTEFTLQFSTLLNWDFFICNWVLKTGCQFIMWTQIFLALTCICIPLHTVGLGSLAASGNFTNGQWTVYVCFQQSMTSTLWTSGKIQWLWWLNSPFAQAKVTVYRQHVYASSETVLDDEKVQWREPLSSVCDAKGEPCAFDDWRQGSWPMLASWVWDCVVFWGTEGMGWNAIRGFLHSRGQTGTVRAPCAFTPLLYYLIVVSLFTLFNRIWELLFNFGLKMNCTFCLILFPWDRFIIWIFTVQCIGQKNVCL